MPDKPIFLGVDVGNYNTKSENVSIPSGYNEFAAKPTYAGNYLCYNGKYYVPREERFDYLMDKTINERHFILTLMSISAELLYRIKKHSTNYQEQVNKVKTIHLGVGVPPAHHSHLAKKYVEYFRERFGDEIDYVYNDIHFHYSVPMIRVFPQDYAVAMEFEDKSEVLKKHYKRYYAVDIGGKTVDFVVIAEGRPEKYRSFENGILTMYNEIKSQALTDFGVRLEDSNCEEVLRGYPSVIDKEVRDMIRRKASEWTNDILSRLRTEGLDFNANPTIFIGGGARMLRQFINKSNLVNNFEFVGNDKANAIAFAKLLRGIQ